MQNRFFIICAICIAFVSGLAWGQAPPTTTTVPVTPPVEPVMSHIPAGAMGFVVVNNIQSLTGNVEVQRDTIRTLGKHTCGRGVVTNIHCAFLTFRGLVIQHTGHSANVKRSLRVHVVGFRQGNQSSVVTTGFHCRTRGHDFG